MGVLSATVELPACGTEGVMTTGGAASDSSTEGFWVESDGGWTAMGVTAGVVASWPVAAGGVAAGGAASGAFGAGSVSWGYVSS